LPCKSFHFWYEHGRMGWTESALFRVRDYDKIGQNKIINFLIFGFGQFKIGQPDILNIDFQIKFFRI
jgi:hypothetical protein